MPASWKSQSNSTPVASSTRLVASAISGPVPSPGMKVTLYVKTVLSVWLRWAAHSFQSASRPATIHGGARRRVHTAGAGFRHPDRRGRQLVPGPLLHHLLADR